MVVLYWDIGRMILDRQDRAGWGARVIDRLSIDLRVAFPDLKGFSPRNLKYMRAFAAAWPDREIVQRVVAQLPWRQNIALIERLGDEKTRLWYAEQVLRNGWSQPILCLQIDRRAHERQGKAVPFDPTFVGRMNLYLSAADDLLRHAEDKPTIGLLLCRSKNKIVVEYALRDLKKPFGVAQWETRIVKSLPKELKGSLPTVEEIERELQDVE